MGSGSAVDRFLITSADRGADGVRSSFRAMHPTWLTMQLPVEVATLICFEPPSAGGVKDGGRSISFLARGSGLVRVIATQPAREVLAIETVRSRLIATARPGDRLLFTLPTPVAEHLGLKVYSRGSRVRGTDDSLVWFVPAPEYYRVPIAHRGRKGLDRPRGGGVRPRISREIARPVPEGARRSRRAGVPHRNRGVASRGRGAPAPRTGPPGRPLAAGGPRRGP